MLRNTYPAFFLYNNNSEERADSQFSYINNPPFIIFPDLLPKNYNKFEPKDERFETTGRSIGIIDETDAVEPLAETMLRAQRTLGKTLAWLLQRRRSRASEMLFITRLNPCKARRDLQIRCFAMDMECSHV